MVEAADDLPQVALVVEKGRVAANDRKYDTVVTLGKRLVAPRTRGANWRSNVRAVRLIRSASWTAKPLHAKTS